jgi:serpin B
MKKAFVSVTLIIFSAFGMTLFSGNPAKVETSTDPVKIAEGNNVFMMKAYKVLIEKEENIFISPYSISSALAMTYAGANGKTETEMGSALEFSANNTSFHQNFGMATESINNIGAKGEIQLNVANSLWLADGYKFTDEFLRTNKTFYKTEMTNLNFAESEKARKTINDWVAEKTKDKIKDLIPEGILDALTKLVLTNAVYFKAEWAEQFKKGNTEKADFTTNKNERVEAELMGLKHYYEYYEDDKVQFIEMPYKGNDASMFVLLPKKKNGLSEIEKDLTWDDILKYSSSMKRKEVLVHFPKFKMSLSYELRDLMRKLGMKDAFSKSADFSKMNGNKDLYISAIIHKTFIAVDEAGTEAAAATAVVMRMKSMPPQEKHAIFRADHPFFYFIKEKSTGTVLFAGRVVDPSAE